MSFTISYREQWKEVTEIPYNNKSSDRYKPVKKYEISNFGRLKKDGKLITPHTWKDKYYCEAMRVINSKFKKTTIKVFIHRLVAYYFVDGYSPELTVNHKDGDRFHNFDTNLEWITDLENKIHAHQTEGVKERSGFNSVLTENDVRKICQLIVENKSTKEIVDEVSSANADIVKRIRTGRTWRHISKDYNFSNYRRTSSTKIPEELIHDICKYLSKNDINSTWKRFKVELKKYHSNPKLAVQLIENRTNFRHISELYF